MSTLAPSAARSARPSSGSRRARVSATGLVVAPSVLLIVLSVTALAVGARSVEITTTLHTLATVLTEGLSPAAAAGMDAAAVTSRIPRTLTAALVGAALAVAGAALQGATRNPLGDPGLLGLSAGASLAMALGIAAGAATSTPIIMALAVAGTLVAAVVVYAVAAAASRVGRTPGSPSPLSLVLAGAAVTAGATALTTALLVLAPPVMERFRYWTVGTVARADLGEALLIGPVILAGIVVAILAAPGLDAIALGDDLAHGLGSRPGRTRALLLLVTVVLTGAAVALAGPVGFIGLIVPHAVRRLRPPTTRALMIGSALWGAVLVVAADILGRTVVAPAEIHLGITTVLLGVPVLLVLLRRTGVSA